MALKPIEIAFSLVSNHKEFRKLMVLERGIYFALVYACLWNDLDPLPKEPTRLAAIVGATPQQWGKGGAIALQAFNATIGILREAYHNRIERRRLNGDNARRSLEASYEKRRLAKLAKLNVFLEAQNFVDSSHGASLLQPQKAQPYRPMNTDMPARQLAKNNKDKATRLIDKS